MGTVLGARRLQDGLVTEARTGHLGVAQASAPTPSGSPLNSQGEASSDVVDQPQSRNTPGSACATDRASNQTSVNQSIGFRSLSAALPATMAGVVGGGRGGGHFSAPSFHVVADEVQAKGVEGPGLAEWLFRDPIQMLHAIMYSVTNGASLADGLIDAIESVCLGEFPPARNVDENRADVLKRLQTRPFVALLGTIVTSDHWVSAVARMEELCFLDLVFPELDALSGLKYTNREGKEVEAFDVTLEVMERLPREADRLTRIAAIFLLVGLPTKRKVVNGVFFLAAEAVEPVLQNRLGMSKVRTAAVLSILQSLERLKHLEGPDSAARKLSNMVSSTPDHIQRVMWLASAMDSVRLWNDSERVLIELREIQLGARHLARESHRAQEAN